MAENENRSANNAAVVHNASNQRFEINLDGQLPVLEYTFKNHRLFLTHTEVPPALEDRGLGKKLAHAALEYARQNDLTVSALCPFCSAAFDWRVLPLEEAQKWRRERPAEATFALDLTATVAPVWEWATQQQEKTNESQSEAARSI